MTSNTCDSFVPLSTHLNSGHLERFKDVAGLSRLRIVRVTEDRMLAASGYIDKASADAATEIVQTALAGMAEHMIEPPLIRQGELVWLYQSNL